MQYRNFGKTGKRVSIIGFGGMRFTSDDDEAVRTMLRARELGVNYFDTAPHYCKDRSEPLFGRALPLMDGPVYVSTKSSIDDDKDAAAVRRRIENALTRMNVEKITFFNMWCIMNWAQFEAVMAKGGPYDGAVKAREEGLIEHITFSTHANGEEIARMCQTGAYEGVTLGYNILNRKNRRSGIAAAARANMGVVAMNPLGGGMIPSGAHRFEFLKRQEEDSVVIAALKFVASHPEITVTLSGMGKVEHVEENVRAGDLTGGPSQTVVDEIAARYEALGQAFCTGCRYCEPCSVGINIPDILACFNRQELGLDREARAFYGWYKREAGARWQGPAACTRCGDCLPRCTQQLPIPDLLEKCHQFFEVENPA